MWSEKKRQEVNELAGDPYAAPSVHHIALAIAKNNLGMQLDAASLADELGLSPSELNVLLHNDAFRKLTQSYKRELEEDNQGIKLKAAIALEDCIPRMHRLIHSSDTPPNVVVLAFRALADAADVKKGSSEVQAGTRFSISIDLSGVNKLGEKVIEVTEDTGRTDVICP
jgi:hypothetical protein